jgi:hypothetical protein
MADCSPYVRIWHEFAVPRRSQQCPFAGVDLPLGTVGEPVPSRCRLCFPNPEMPRDRSGLYAICLENNWAATSMAWAAWR